MTLFVDASALVALVEDEPERHRLEAALDSDGDRVTSGVALWEATRAISRGGDPERGLDEVRRYCGMLEIREIGTSEPETEQAIRAHVRYGKGTGHPATLNMGDCFAYACARTSDARLLYKSDDLTQTDMA